VTRRLPATLAAVAFAAGAVLAGPAPAAQAASCEAGAGVTVVVDFASLGGGVGTRCAAGDPDTGVQALTGAGYSPERAVQERSGYFLCRIDGQPASDPCQRAASSSAYWSYWHARPGGSWTFSNTGPGSFDPAPGSIEGWAYGAGRPPSVAPPAAAQPPPAPPADRPPPAQASAAQEPSPAPQRAQSAGSPATAAKPKPTRTPGSPTTNSSPAVSPPAETATALGSPEVATAPEPASPEPSTSTAASASPEPSAAPDDPEATPTSARTDSSPAGPLAAALLVLALLAAGGWQVVHRRREQL